MFLLIDNYDSFTYNLVQYFQCLGEDPLVLKNDDPKILDLAKSGTLDKVVLSPGPSVPEKAGFCLDFLKLLPKTVPVLGVCLGHEIRLKHSPDFCGHSPRGCHEGLPG